CGEWDRWSRQSDHYEEGACARKWATFSAGGGLTLGSLVHWAEEDGWAPPWRAATSPQVEKPPPTPGDAAAAVEQLSFAMLEAIRSRPQLLRAWQDVLGAREGGYYVR